MTLGNSERLLGFPRFTGLQPKESCAPNNKQMIDLILGQDGEILLFWETNDLVNDNHNGYLDPGKVVLRLAMNDVVCVLYFT